MTIIRVTDALDRHVINNPDGIAVEAEFLRLTWKDLLDKVEEKKSYLESNGIKQGDRVGLIAQDDPDTLIVILAILRLGAVHVPIDPLSIAKNREKDFEVALGLNWLILMKNREQVRVKNENDLLLIKKLNALPVEDPLGSGQSAYIRLSSGTTGTAKGILLSHQTILDRIESANVGLKIGPSDKVLWMLPMAYHLVVSILLYITKGATIVFGKGLQASNIPRIARATNISVMYAAPWHLRQLSMLPVGNDLPTSLRLVVSTTAALDFSTILLFRERHKIGIQQGLGVIEVGLPLLSAGKEGEKVGEFGLPQPSYTVAIRDEAGQDLPIEQPGELCIAGPGLFDAYLFPWKTRDQVLIRGMFHTGDLAKLTADGSVILLGRIKDVINVAGVKVFCLEIESVLAAHPKVEACRVFSIQDDRFGEVVGAEVQLKKEYLAEGSTKPEEIVRELSFWCSTNLAKIKCPARITIVPLLEKTGSGKVIKG